MVQPTEIEVKERLRRSVAAQRRLREALGTNLEASPLEGEMESSGVVESEAEEIGIGE